MYADVASGHRMS